MSNNTPNYEDQFPSLSPQDVARFVKAFEGNGSTDQDTSLLVKNLQEYAQFRQQYQLDLPENSKPGKDDAADWKWASATAIQAAHTCQTELIPGVEDQAPLEDRVCHLRHIPQFCFAHTLADGRTPVLTESGHVVIQYLPARLDIGQASPELFSLVVLLYLDRKANVITDFDARGAVLMSDCRQGEGWPNLKVTHLFGFLKIFVHAINKIHPGRLTKLTIYSIPYIAVSIWHMTKVFLPKALSENTTLVNGGDNVKDAIPKKKLSKYMAPEAIDQMEALRLRLFKESSSDCDLDTIEEEMDVGPAEETTALQQQLQQSTTTTTLPIQVVGVSLLQGEICYQSNVVRVHRGLEAHQHFLDGLATVQAWNN